MPELKAFHDFSKAQGWEIIHGDYLFSEHHQLAGTDQERRSDLQNMMNREDLSAIWFARGGYGTVRVLEGLDFSKFKEHPKWMIGYSDLTAFHLQLYAKTQLKSLHGTMPVNFKTNTPECLEITKGILEGSPNPYEWNSGSDLSLDGKAEGVLVGGNLSVIYSLLGSESIPDMNGKILFIEDLDEYLYHIDRMMMNLKRNGILEEISGLVVGGMTDMNDNAIPWGKRAEETIYEHFKGYGKPLAFDFSGGHVDHHLPLIHGEFHTLEVNQGHCRLSSV